jgi:6-phosphogluconolactonase/glucosamine-6-phosphate isomerase/deaminase
MLPRLTKQHSRWEQKYFSSETKLSHGVTLGITTLMEARHIILIVSGEHKADAVRQVLEGEISEQRPASYLRHHPQFTVFLDTPAAKLLSNI